MTAKLLFVGDMHLGRVPARVPSALDERGLPARACGPAAAWERTVDYALAHRPDAVVFAGDLVESDNARFEAYPILARGVRRLVKSGIAVCGVAGNHDVDALPRLARAIPGFRLLGPDGGWETLTIARDGTPLVDVVGRSFPRRGGDAEVPLASFPRASDGRPRLGVVHGDLDQSGSRYAPVRRRDLEETDAAGWFLGHVHNPSLAAAARPIGYLGSLVGLDPTETGARGPWWVEVDPAGAIRLEHLPLAPLRWEAWSIEVDPATDADGVLEQLDRAITDHAARLRSSNDEFRVLGCRVRLVGRVRAARAITEDLHRIAREDSLCISLPDDRWAFVDHVANDLAPDLDLTELARGDDPPGLLAADLLALETNAPEADALIAAVRTQLDAAAGSSSFRSCAPWDRSDEAIRTRLLRAGRRALEVMLDPRDADGDSR